MAKKPLDDNGPLISQDAVAHLLMCSREWVLKLTQQGALRKDVSGKYYLVQVVHDYLRWRDSEDRRVNKSAAQTRVSDARTRDLELRIAEREGRLVEFAEFIEMADMLCGVVRSELSGLAARVTRDLQVRRTIETAVNDILDTLADAATESARMVGEGRATAEAIAAAFTGGLGGAKPNLPAERGGTGTA